MRIMLVFMNLSYRLSKNSEFRSIGFSAPNDVEPDHNCQLPSRHQPTLWVHGHTHVGLDYRTGQTRVICNPHGYGNENPAFDPALVIDIA